MKYIKKVPYFKKGDKIDKAARNLPKKQKEAVLKVSSAQKEQERKDKLSSVGAGFKKPTAKVVAPVDTRSAQIKSTVGKKAAKTRGQAFQEARKRGDSEFLWQGKRYHTRTAEEEAERTANAGKTSKDKTSKDKTSKDKTSKDKTSTKVEQSTSPWITRPVTDRYGNIVQGPGASTTAPAQSTQSVGNTREARQNYVRDVQARARVINAQKKKDKLETKRAAQARRKKYWEDNNTKFQRRGGTINKFQRGTQGSGITRADLPKTSK